MMQTSLGELQLIEDRNDNRAIDGSANFFKKIQIRCALIEGQLPQLPGPGLLSQLRVEIAHHLQGLVMVGIKFKELRQDCQPLGESAHCHQRVSLSKQKFNLPWCRPGVNIGEPILNILDHVLFFVIYF